MVSQWLAWAGLGLEGQGWVPIPVFDEGNSLKRGAKEGMEVLFSLTLV